MALSGSFPRAPERYALVQEHVVANFRRLADHHAHPVVNEQPPSDLGAGVNLDSRKQPRSLAYHARQRKPSPTVQAMRHAVQKDGVKAGIAKQDLQRAACGGIALEQDRKST